MNSLCHSAQMLVGFHVHFRGGPDILGQNRRLLFGLLDRASAELFANFIADALVKETYIGLLEQLTRLADHDVAMVNWLANFLGRQAPETDKERRSLWRVVQREITAFEQEQRVGPLPWLREPTYQKLMMLSIDILLVIEDIENRIRARMDELEPGVSKQPTIYDTHSEPLVPAIWRDGTYVEYLKMWPPIPRPRKRV